MPTMMTDNHLGSQAVLRDIRGLIRYHEILGVGGYPRTPALENFLRGPETRASIPAPARAPAMPPVRPPDETLAAIRARVEGCDRCGLHEHRSRIVFGQGNGEAGLMIVTGWPEREDEASGEPFSGADGELLDKMLAAIGLDRARVYLTGLVKCRPDGKEGPAAEEVAACLPFLKQQIAAVAPRVICAMGPPAARYLLQTDEPLVRLRGRFHSCRLDGDRTVRLMPTFHPAFLLRNQEMKHPCWQDLLMIQRALRGRP